MTSASMRDSHLSSTTMERTSASLSERYFSARSVCIALWPSATVLVAASLVYGYGIGHVTTLGPIVVRREFGAAAFGATYGSAATVIQVVSALGPALFGVLRDAFGGYAVVLGAASLCTMLGAGLLLSGRRAS